MGRAGFLRSPFLHRKGHAPAERDFMADGEKTVIRAEHLSDTVPAGKESKKEYRAALHTERGLHRTGVRVCANVITFLLLAGFCFAVTGHGPLWCVRNLAPWTAAHPLIIGSAPETEYGRLVMLLGLWAMLRIAVGVFEFGFLKGILIYIVLAVSSALGEEYISSNPNSAALAALHRVLTAAETAAVSIPERIAPDCTAGAVIPGSIGAPEFFLFAGTVSLLYLIYSAVTDTVRIVRALF